MRFFTANFLSIALAVRSHFIVRVAALVIISFVVAALFFAPKTAAVNRTWDGGGGDNNWTTGANWSGDTVPGAGDVAIFDGTSTKDATIDIAFSVQGIQINAGYTGAITQAPGVSLTVGVSGYSQSAGTFTGGSGNITFNAAFAQSGGAFQGSTGNLDFNSNFTLSGGTFMASSTTTSFALNLTQTGGAFAPNGGTVVFDSDGNTFLDVPTSLTLNNVTVNKAGLAALALQNGGDTLIVAGTLALTDGVVNGVSTTLEAQGDVLIAATFNGGNIGFRFGGPANQTYTNAGAPNLGGAWTINKPSGIVTATTNLTLGTSQPLTITSGTLYLNNNSSLTSGVLTIGANGRLVNDSSTTITLGANGAAESGLHERNNQPNQSRLRRHEGSI